MESRPEQLDWCFKYAVLSALFPASATAHRSAKYEEHMDKLEWAALEFPLKLSDISKFEKLNADFISVDEDGREYRGIAVSVFGWSKGEDDEDDFAHVLYKSKLLGAERRVNLALLFDDAHHQQQHYCWIKSFSRFAYGGAHNDGRKRLYCAHCLTGFAADEKQQKKNKQKKEKPLLTAEQKLEQHMSFGCADITQTRPVMPTEEEKVLSFTASSKEVPVRYAMYGDFECLLTAEDEQLHPAGESYTETFSRHEPCGYCLFVVSTDLAEEFDFPNPLVVRGTELGVQAYYADVPKNAGRVGEPMLHQGEPVYESVVSSFINAAQRREKQLGARIKAVAPMDMSARALYGGCRTNARVLVHEVKLVVVVVGSG